MLGWVGSLINKGWLDRERYVPPSERKLRCGHGRPVQRSSALLSPAVMFGTRKTWDLGHAPCLQELWKKDISLDDGQRDEQLIVLQSESQERTEDQLWLCEYLRCCLLNEESAFRRIQLYRNTTLGNSLQESLDELIQTQQITPQLALQVLLQFDKAINTALANRVRNRVNFRGSLNTYRFCDNVWTFVLNDVEFREVTDLVKVDKVKIVACDGKSESTQNKTDK
ncbi:kinesin-like protein KIFC3 isoform X8 [Lates japonicus]|uniref:Transcription initiation factor IIA subunit 2 n=1 Tax=Lates japonicus TaxID=270547 RepID=A0AAD3MC40_LATJO|nr:kinesin-like protein KIFC3 isoform X8 [Lates japonicus]